jgi:hypothetical protein
MYGTISQTRSQDSLVRIVTKATCWTAGVDIFLYSRASRASRPALRPTQPPIQWVPGDLSSEVKLMGHEADRSPSASAEVKNGGAIPPLPHTSLWHSAQLLD